MHDTIASLRNFIVHALSDINEMCLDDIPGTGLLTTDMFLRHQLSDSHTNIANPPNSSRGSIQDDFGSNFEQDMQRVSKLQDRFFEGI